MTDNYEQPLEDQAVDQEPESEEEIPEEEEQEEEHDTDESDTEEPSEEESEEQAQAVEQVQAPKKKGKSRNQRMNAKLSRLENENDELKAQMAYISSQFQPQQSAQDPQAMQAPGQPQQAQQPVSQDQLLHQIKMQKFAQSVNDLRSNNEDVDTILNDKNHSYNQLQPGVQNTFPLVGLTPERLFDINKQFPKEIKSLRGQSADGQIATLLRLDGKLGALKANRQERIKSAPSPTGALKGASARVSGELSPAQELKRLRKVQRGG